MRLDINQILNEMTFTDLEEIWKNLDYCNQYKIGSNDFEEFKRKKR